MKRLALLVVLALMLTGCGKDLLDGKITSRGVNPGYTYIYLMPQYTTSCSGNPSVCTQTVSFYLPIPYFVPPCYWVRVKGETDDATGSTCIDKSLWEKKQVGDHYTGKDVTPRDRQQKKHG